MFKRDDNNLYENEKATMIQLIVEIQNFEFGIEIEVVECRDREMGAL